MKQFKLFLSIAGILGVGFQLFAQQGGNGPERFYNVESYKADITLTFNYKLIESGETSTRTVIATQKIQHFVTTASGQKTIGDMFQIEREDKGKGETHKGDLYGDRINLDKMAEAMKNSNVDPKVFDMLQNSKKEAQSFNLSFDKYKNWMIVGVGAGAEAKGLASSSYISEFSDKTNGTIHCGEGQGMGPFLRNTNYTGEGQMDPCKPGVDCGSSFVLQLNLDNNTYSFTIGTELPPGSQFIGESYSKECGYISNKPIERNASSFMGVNTKKGVIYKHPLPEIGMKLSGSKIITNESSLTANLSEDANWSVKIDWTISPADK